MPATAAKAPRLTGEQRREQILDVTKALAGARGFHAISIDAVARRAGITRPVVYGHFGDLAGLLRALVEREGARAVGQLMKLLPAPDAAKDPEEILLDGLRAFLEAVRDEPVTWQLVLMPSEGTPEILRERAITIRRAVTDQLAALTPQVLAGTDIPPPPDPELSALTMQAVAEDAARLLLAQPDEFPIERLMTHAEWIVGRMGLRAAS
jgi:AcrR family transcriptional regulator